ncbi:MAG: 50S ribosomal protein L20 [Patescibacteria group bacterium]
MPRVKRGVQHTKRRANLMKAVKGYGWGRKSKIRLARTAMLKAGRYAFRDRRARKRDFRSLWTMKINAGARANGTTYSKLINGLKVAGSTVDRKILATLAETYPEVFKKIIAAVQK